MTARLGHLSRRFVTSLAPGGLPPADRQWVQELLSEAEQDLFWRMSRADQRHGVRVARRVEGIAGDGASGPLLAAALLHDVGKAVAGLGTSGRVLATLSELVIGRERAVGWIRRRGILHRIGLYLRHPELGGDLLELAGSHPLVVAWARQHHLQEVEWTVPNAAGRTLRSADRG